MTLRQVAVRQEGDRVPRVSDTRIVAYEPLLSPAALLEELPLADAMAAVVVERSRAEARHNLLPLNIGDGCEGCSRLQHSLPAYTPFDRYQSRHEKSRILLD